MVKTANGAGATGTTNAATPGYTSIKLGTLTFDVSAYSPANGTSATINLGVLQATGLGNNVYTFKENGTTFTNYYNAANMGTGGAGVGMQFSPMTITFGEGTPVEGALVVQGKADGAGSTVNLGRVMVGSTATQVVTLHNTNTTTAATFAAANNGSAAGTPASGPVAAGGTATLNVGLAAGATKGTLDPATSFVNVTSGLTGDTAEKIGISGTVVAKRTFNAVGDVTIPAPAGTDGHLKGAKVSANASVASPDYASVTNPTVAGVVTGGAAINVPVTAVLDTDSKVVTLPVAAEGLTGEGTYTDLSVTVKSAAANVGKAPINNQPQPQGTWLFGDKLGAEVAASTQPTALAGLSSYVVREASTLGTTATILAGNMPTAGTVTMAWRNRNNDEKVPGPKLPKGVAFLASDVVDLNGIGTNAANPMVLQMTYDETLFLGNANETALANAKLLGLASFQNDKWVLEDPLNKPYIPGGYNGVLTVGNWGVDVVNNVAWAVVDHNSQFAVVPEPGTISLVLAGCLGFVVMYLRRKKA